MSDRIRELEALVEADDAGLLNESEPVAGEDERHELATLKAERDSLFDPERYPHLRRVVHDDQRGRIELLSVDETSDGFLIGQAQIGEGENAYHHSVFLGNITNFK